MSSPPGMPEYYWQDMQELMKTLGLLDTMGCWTGKPARCRKAGQLGNRTEQQDWQQQHQRWQRQQKSNAF